MSTYEPWPSGCTPFEEELTDAMNNFADSTNAPAFDTVGMVHRTRRRRTGLIAGFAAALIVAGGGTALASMTGASQTSVTPAATTVDHDRTTLLLGGVTKEPIAIDLTGMNLEMAKAPLLKAQLKLGTVTEVSIPGCKPTSVVEVSPHSPKIVSEGDTVNVKLCAG
ncbi:PASTA domain-containing protein [Streptomyces sp. NPDC048565]|uniref:PASTA domain-containing protein n=1 Tax=Streptomyces sp. NPDC048565 TaxID=3155266 RepID=UPI003436B7D4